jgi:hypothetical protein
MTNEQKLRIGKKLSPKTHLLTDEEKIEIRETLWNDKEFIDFCKNKYDWTTSEHDCLLNILELPKNEAGYYLNKFNEPCAYNGIRTLKRAMTNLNLSKIHLNEIQKVKNNLKYFRKYYSFIITRNGIERPEPRDYQESLESALNLLKDTVILYPRQSGKTVTTGTYLLWRTLNKENINIGIVANKGPTAEEVLDKIKKIFIEMPIWLQSGVVTWNKRSVEFDNGVRVMTDSPSSDSFRGYTINLLYIDEMAYIPKTDWDAFADSVFPTMNSLSFKQFIATSTANGINHFSELVKQAKQIDSEYEFVTCSWKEVPRYDKQGNIIPPKKYKEQTIKKYGLKYFLQTEANEFLGSSDTLVDGVTLKRIQDHIEALDVNNFPSSIFNDLTIYKKPEKNHSYICSVDSSKDGIDDFSVHIIDITKFPFEQVADANLQVDYLVMPEYLDELGKLYNNALMIIENNEGSGQSISDTLWSVYSYENMYRDKNIEGKAGFKRYTGFRTTAKSRTIILGLLKVFLEENKIIINSKTTLQQLYTFTKKNNKYQAQDGYKDDNLMAVAIAFAPFMESKTFDDYELFIKELRTESGVKTKEFMSVLDLSFDDDGNDAVSNFEKTKKALEEMGDLNSFDGYGIPENFGDTLRDNWR